MRLSKLDKKTTESYPFQKRGFFLLFRRMILEQTAIIMPMLKMLKENQQPWPIIASRQNALLANFSIMRLEKKSFISGNR